ncbi:MAG: SagB/ThcOx family dehydrogenase [Kiritimatiellae bacterium]|nr:SagB/ThcOx family dehydrogenase [Kiritimatiellia bacterium]
MKTPLIASFAAIFAAVAFADCCDTVKLPTPTLDSGMSVTEALKARKSIRAFAPDALSCEELSTLLWAANGFNRPDKRTNATGMNKQTIIIYVCMESGAYRYDAKENALVKICGKDLRPAVAASQEFAATAPVSLIIAADVSDPVYNGQWSALSCYDAGIVSGNIYLFCAANGLATVCRGTMDRDTLKKELALPDGVTLHLNHPVGRPL